MAELVEVSMDRNNVAANERLIKLNFMIELRVLFESVIMKN
jgi:hypothetical protein